MPIERIGVTHTQPAFLPLQRPAGDSFSQALRARIRADAAEALGGGARPSANSAAVTARASALQQSFLARMPLTADASAWLQTAREIGGQYLPAGVADVFARQMQLESGGFDPDVIAGRKVSTAGAEGIAQLMPSSYPNVNRLDPVASLNAAAATMRTNIQQFNGDVRKALAAYNAGTGTVSAAVAQFGAAWERGLPAETQRYLRELLGGAA